jgi:hypothetical protein
VTHTLDPTDAAVLGATRSADGRGQAQSEPRAVHRLRDLDRRGRWVALALALALSLAPVLAFAWATPDWAPAGDPAFMGIRALDVGTARTPLIGQPSTASQYIGGSGHVNHPGPLHFYLLAASIRVFGGDVGMPLVTVLIVEAAVLIGAWAVFRQLGPAAGVLGAVVLGAVMFTTGASSLVDPVSSSIAGYPLLLASVLCWCVLCGDLRLLPLTTAVVSFTAQQHLSVAPAMVVLGLAAALGVVLARHRRGAVRACAWSVLVAVAAWSPVLLQQVISADGNLGRLLSYTRNSDRATLGASSALHQIAHALGLPPLLGQTEPSGWKLLASPSALTWCSAVAVVLAVAGLGLWWRRRQPRHATLAAMVGVLVLAGLANGSSVPVGLLEQGRLAFYHWAFALAFFVALVLGLGLYDLARRHLAPRLPLAPALVALALVGIVVPAAINPGLERHTNTLPAAHAYLASRYVHRLGDAVLAHRRELGARTVLLSRGGQLYSGFREAVAFELTERGVDVLHPLPQRGFVDGDRLVDAATVDSGLVVVSGSYRGEAPPGRLLGEVKPAADLDVDAYRALIAQAEAAHDLRVGPRAEAGLEAIDDYGDRFIIWAALGQLTSDPARVLIPEVLEFLRDHPIEEPRLDPALIRRVLDSTPATWSPDTAFGLRVYLLDRAELLRFARKGEL